MDPSLEEELLPHLNPNEDVEAMMRLHHPGHVPEKVKVISDFGEIITCRIKRSEIPEVYQSPLKKSLKASRFYTLQAPGQTESNREEQPALYYDSFDLKAPTGKGVVVAVLDWGIDFAHENFRNTDGSTRFRAIFDQSIKSKGTRPYGYGRIITQEEINRALKTNRPYATLGYHPAKADFLGIGSHGTHVTDIAAGNRHTYKGFLPAAGADLIFVHMAARNSSGLANLGDATRILEAIDFVRKYAGDDPLVINISMGKHGGGHDGLSLVEIGMDNFIKSRPNTMICQSVGNYYLANAHSRGIVRPGKEKSFRFYVDKADKTPNELEIWYAGEDEFGVELFNLNTRQSYRNSRGNKTEMTDEQDELIGRIYHRVHEPNNGKNHINIFLYRGAPPGVWEVRLRGKRITDGRYHAWVERDQNCRGCKVVFAPEDSDRYFTNGSICNGKNAIVVGAYDHRDPVRKLAPFSSQGPTVDGRFKPDIIAPGIRIQAARSAPGESRKALNQQTIMSGTSMAAPHVTNTVALILEILPKGTPFWIIRNIIMGTTDHVNSSSMRSGTGILNQQAAIKAARQWKSGLPIPRQVISRHRTNNLLNPFTMHSNQESVLIESESYSPINEEVNTAENQRSLGDFKLQPNSSPTRVRIDTSSILHQGNSFDEALKFSLQRQGEVHSVVLGSLLTPGRYRVFDVPQSMNFITRPVMEANLTSPTCCLVLNALDPYFPEQPSNPTRRWIRMPRMKEFYSLTNSQQSAHRTRWIRHLFRARTRINMPGQTIDRNYLRSLSSASLRLLIANFGEHVHPVRSIRRNNRDTGGISNGSTKPLFHYPLSEPDCYFSVISLVEGSMESINAWDYKAGISIGPIQINVNRGALHRWLYLLYTRDRTLFDRELGNHYQWTMTLDGNEPVLHVRAGTRQALQLRGDSIREVRRSYGYFQSGDPTRHRWAQIDPNFRREMARRFSRILAWPHVQEFVLEVSAWWSRPGLQKIQRAGITALNTTRPDHDKFILKAILMSAYVRFSGCLQPILNGLRRYTTVSSKLANWENSLNTTSATCRGLRNRLRSQVNHADSIHSAIVGMHPTPSPGEVQAGQVNQGQKRESANDSCSCEQKSLNEINQSDLKALFSASDAHENFSENDLEIIVDRGAPFGNSILEGDILLQQTESGEIFAHLIREGIIKPGTSLQADRFPVRQWGHYLTVRPGRYAPSTDNQAKMVSEDGMNLRPDQLIIRKRNLL